MRRSQAETRMAGRADGNRPLRHDPLVCPTRQRLCMPDLKSLMRPRRLGPRYSTKELGFGIAVAAIPFFALSYLGLPGFAVFAISLLACLVARHAAYSFSGRGQVSPD